MQILLTYMCKGFGRQVFGVLYVVCMESMFCGGDGGSSLN